LTTNGVIIWDGWLPPMVSSVTVFPEMPALGEVSHRNGVVWWVPPLSEAAYVTTPGVLPATLPNWPEAVPVREPLSVLLRVKLKSLSAWPALRKSLAASVLVRMTCTVPAPVVTWAVAARELNPVPALTWKFWTVALAGFGPEASARSAMTKLKRVKLSFMRCFSLRDLYVFVTRPAGEKKDIGKEVHHQVIAVSTTAWLCPFSSAASFIPPNASLIC
jgi:hypothetical protein